MPVYASVEDLASLGLHVDAQAGIPSANIAAALEAASRLADSYLQSRYRLPLTSWGQDLRRCVAILAAYDIMSARGFAPEGADEHLRLRAEDATRWLEGVARGSVSPTAIVDSAPAAPPIDGLHAHTSPKRWP